jgi:hypothetical protein
MPDVLHWFINVLGREIGDPKTFVHSLAKQLGGNTVQQLNAAILKIAGGPRPVTGYDGTVSIRLMRRYKEWIHVLDRHPKYAAILALYKCLAGIGDILLERFEHDDPLINEFEVLSNELASIVFDNFSGKPNLGCPCHNLDKQGRRMNVRVDCTYIERYPVVKFPFGICQHNTLRHMVPLMRKHGELIKFFSWVIEAANKHWKRILSEHTSRGGGRANAAFERKHIAAQALQWYLRMVDSEMVELSKRDKRERGVQTCSRCKRERTLGHSKICHTPIVRVA